MRSTLQSNQQIVPALPSLVESRILENYLASLESQLPVRGTQSTARWLGTAERLVLRNTVRNTMSVQRQSMSVSMMTMILIVLLPVFAFYRLSIHRSTQFAAVQPPAVQNDSVIHKTQSAVTTSDFVLETLDQAPMPAHYLVKRNMEKPFTPSCVGRNGKLMCAI